MVEGEPVEMVDADADGETAAAQAEDVVPEDSLPEDGGEAQAPSEDRTAAEVSEFPEDGEPAAETASEEQEKPQEPGSRSFY